MSDKFDELAKGLAQSVTRRPALRRFSVGLAGGSGSWWAEPNRGEARLLGKRVLLVVEGKEAIGRHLDGDGHMKQVHRANGHFEGVFVRKFTCCANSLGPGKFHVRPVAEPNLLFEQTDEPARLASPDEAGSLSLIEAVEHFNALPRRPQDLRLRLPVEERNGGSVMDVAPGFVSQPPGGVGVAPHFLSERRKATPSNFVALGSPTARFSASCLVIRGRALWGLRGLARPLPMDTAVFMRRRLCRQLRSMSRRTCRPNRPRSR